MSTFQSKNKSTSADPRLVIAVMIDEPAGGAYYGGQVAAPAFAQIASAALRTLQVAPDGPLETPKALLAMRSTP